MWQVKKSNNILFCEKRAEIHIELFQIIIKMSLNEKKHQSCKLSNLWHNKINTMSFSNFHSVKNTFDHIHTNNLFWPIIFVFVRVISPVYNTLINMIGYIKIGINEQRIIPFQTLFPSSLVKYTNVCKQQTFCYRILCHLSI